MGNLVEANMYNYKKIMRTKNTGLRDINGFLLGEDESHLFLSNYFYKYKTDR